jgi:hypothetical protein
MIGGSTCGALNAVRVQEQALGCECGACGCCRDSSVKQSVVLAITAQQVHRPADEAQTVEVLDAREMIGMVCCD